MLGPGGKGFNQRVAACQLGAEVSFATQLGWDNCADIAQQTQP
jgi:sugar/nucleoside kinase (ribokinase family)